MDTLSVSIDNARIAERLREAADLLAAQGANPFRVNAYLKAADAVVQTTEPLELLYEQGGVAGLETIPGVGVGLATAIAELISTGRWTQLERLRGAVDPTDLFQSVPGIGVDLAHRIHDTLRVDTLEALEIAAHDGRLESVPGLGPRRSAAIRAALASMLQRSRRRPPSEAAAEHEPSVAALLAIDREYREQAAAGKLKTIAPRRFNPGGEAWLPVLHTTRGDWHFTALYSNTARAHELGMTRDWVVIYFEADHRGESQRTVVTESRGVLAGKRVVRGRERECLALR